VGVVGFEHAVPIPIYSEEYYGVVHARREPAKGKKYPRDVERGQGGVEIETVADTFPWLRNPEGDRRLTIDPVDGSEPTPRPEAWGWEGQADES